MRCGYETYPNVLSLIENGRANTEIALRSYMWGITVDQEEFQKIADQVQAEISSEEKIILTLVPEGTNINSKKQLAEIFFEQFGEPVKFTTDSGSPKVDKEALEFIKTYGESEKAQKLATHLLTYGLWKKRQTTYITPYIGMSMIRPRPNPGDQVSGRWGYRAPALQTWPYFMKGMFVSRPNNYLVACDLSQAELRVIALLANDQPLLDAYNAGKDVHKLNAGDLFGVDMDSLSPENYKKFRNAAKTFAFALNYSTLDDESAAKTILSRLHTAGFGDMTIRLVLGAVKRWWKAHPALRIYKQELWDRANVQGYVEDVFSGRRRYLYGKGKDTEVFNFPLQAAVATIMDRAVQEVDQKMDHTKEGLIVQVHDCLVIETYDSDRGVKMLMDAMHKPLEYDGRSILMAGDPEMGHRYGKLEGVKV